MAIAIVCDACGTQRRVKDEFLGKRIRCPTCNESLRVRPAQDHDFQTPGPLSSRRKLNKKRRRTSKPLTPWQRSLIFAQRNPWVGLSVLYLLVWVPLSILSPALVLIVNIILLALCCLGAVVGLFCALAGVAIKNPLETLSLATVGAVATVVGGPRNLAAKGKQTSKAIGSARVNGLYEADTGPAGKMAVYCGIASVVLLAHIVVLLFKVTSS